MKSSSSDEWPVLGRLLVFGFALRALAALLNPGFFAYDDYQSMLRLLVPAQEYPGWSHLIEQAELRSPLARVPGLAITKAAAFVGVTDPIDQVRVLYLAMGLFSLLGIYWAYRIFATMGRPVEARIAAFLVAGHALMPYLSTRVMFETVPITLALGIAYLSQEYVRGRGLSRLLLALVLLTIACVPRPTLGVWALPVAAFPLLRRRWLDFGGVVVAGAALFVGLGLIELQLRGDFHASLRHYLNYNLESSSSYGTKPFYFYLPLAFALTGAVFFVWRARRVAWRRDFAPLWVSALYFVVFLFGHSLVPHKEERFFFPALGLGLVMVAPLVAVWSDRRRFLRALAGVSVALAIAIACFPSQWNVVGLVRGMARDTKHYRYKESAELFPAAYASHQLTVPTLIADFGSDTLAEVSACRARLIVRRDYLEEVAVPLSQLRLIAEYSPGPLEALVVKMNPRKNGRRGSLYVYGCQQ